ncbi:hypothetical protein CUN61_22710 [Pseudomonas arsenicoxydans]|uniref:Uncharacterized protein n=1 Tax=Pseudomonas arsenicoxydans TaxID=702115 RepID=A0A4V0YKB8_9PSED|nr:hypothetical protein CUN61_22710 [Pseudomonas arsenicoxydans]
MLADIPLSRASPLPQGLVRILDRVGGGFTSAVLSHHRTYGSVYGGSSYTTEPVYRIQYRD